MSLEISVAVVVANGDERLVNVGRFESVLPVVLTEQPDAQANADLIDLARARLDALAADVLSIADAQVAELRDLLAT